METETDDDLVGTHSNWVQHPYTRKVARDLGGLHTNLLSELLSACARTTDPGVALAYGRYQQSAASLSLYMPRRSAS